MLHLFHPQPYYVTHRKIPIQGIASDCNVIHPCTRLRTAIFDQKHISSTDPPWLPHWSLILQYVKDKFESRLMIRPIRWNFPKSHTFLSKAALVYQPDFRLVFVSRIYVTTFKKKESLQFMAKAGLKTSPCQFLNRVTQLISLWPFTLQHHPLNLQPPRLIC